MKEGGWGGKEEGKVRQGKLGAEKRHPQGRGGEMANDGKVALEVRDL